MNESLEATPVSPEHTRARELALAVLVEAFGASATPFVPVPFVDDWMFGRLLRRIAVKVLASHAGLGPDLPRVVVDAYGRAGAPALVSSVAVGAVRFVIRKVAIVLDVKKSYDVFGQSIAFALALEIAAHNGWLHEASAERVGAAIHQALQQVGSGTLSGVGRAAREAYSRGGGVTHFTGAIGAEVDAMHDQLEAALGATLGPRKEPKSR